MRGRSLKRILLIEDDPDIQTITSLALGSFGGFDVHVSGSAREALAEAAALRPDLVLLDVMMPGMDGIETLRALRLIPETAATPVVFLTARVQPSDIARYQELGAIGIVRKPFEPTTLADTVRQMWSRSTAARPARHRLRDLKHAYRADLPQKLQLIADDAAAVRAGDCDRERLQSLYGHIHRLAGSAAVYGFDQISRAAGELELWALAALARGELEPRHSELDQLLGALERAARASGGRAASPRLGRRP